ncbi:MAG TPA: ATP-binding protein, partial [Candidatus Limnocylindria bacterium]|nr:ATP-binding protein [Candidatus Limnocylindria bacterium]
MEPETPDVLRSSVRDLVALSTLPGLWMGREVPEILSGLVDVAVTMSRLDLAYARLAPDGHHAAIEAAAGRHPEPLAPHAAAIGRALHPWLDSGATVTGVEIRHPLGTGPLHFALIPFGGQAPRGVLAVGSRRAGFPTEIDSLLLGIAVSQAALCIRAASVMAERDRGERALHRRALQLKGLTTAAAAMNSLALDEALRVITDEARAIIGAHQAVTTLTGEHAGPRAAATVSLSPKYAEWRAAPGPDDGFGIAAMVSGGEHVVRMTQAELEASPAFQSRAAQARPMRGWLAARLIARNGRTVGLIQLSDKLEGEFTGDDEALLVQLAQMASVAVENAQLFRRAEESNQAKDEFMAMLSHELRTPLNAIVGWTTMLKSGALDATTAAHAVDVIDRNSRHQGQLIEDLLDVSRITAGKLVLQTGPVYLPAVVEAAIDSASPAALAKGVAMRVVVAPGVKPVSGDADRLQQVVWNLLSNALKFTPAGGRVDVLCRTRDGHVELTVRDTGMGIPADVLPHIFERFRQSEAGSGRAYGGLGLGLAIVRYLVELHGGTVTADSEGEGKGAAFTVRLPLMPHLPLPAAAAGPPTQEEVKLGSLRLLVVDDERDTRELLCFILKQAGAEVTAVGSVFDATAILEELRPHVIVSDIGMPGADGYALIRSIRSLTSVAATPVIALTAFAGAGSRALAEDAGFDLHLAKPVEP